MVIHQTLASLEGGAGYTRLNANVIITLQCEIECAEYSWLIGYKALKEEKCDIRVHHVTKLL